MGDFHRERCKTIVGKATTSLCQVIVNKVTVVHCLVGKKSEFPCLSSYGQ